MTDTIQKQKINRTKTLQAFASYFLKNWHLPTELTIFIIDPFWDWGIAEQQSITYTQLIKSKWPSSICNQELFWCCSHWLSIWLPWVTICLILKMSTWTSPLAEGGGWVTPPHADQLWPVHCLTVCLCSLHLKWWGEWNGFVIDMCCWRVCGEEIKGSGAVVRFCSKPQDTCGIVSHAKSKASLQQELFKWDWSQHCH